jgi:hypothetical protein
MEINQVVTKMISTPIECNGCYIEGHCSFIRLKKQVDCPCKECLVKITCEYNICDKFRQLSNPGYKKFIS